MIKLLPGDRRALPNIVCPSAGAVSGVAGVPFVNQRPHVVLGCWVISWRGTWSQRGEVSLRFWSASVLPVGEDRASGSPSARGVAHLLWPPPHPSCSCPRHRAGQGTFPAGDLELPAPDPVLHPWGCWSWVWGRPGGLRGRSSPILCSRSCLKTTTAQLTHRSYGL